MARANLPAKKYKKSNPTMLRLSFEGQGSQTRFIDLAQALSAVNRKFYRQGLYYYVNSVEFYNNEQGVVDIMTIPDNWVTKNAWNRGFDLFQKMNSMVDPPISGIGRPKYHDFKVFMSREHHNIQSSIGNMLPHTYYPGASANQRHGEDGEWNYSQFVSADDDGDNSQQSDAFYVHMVGDHDGSGSPNDWATVGLIKSYADSRSTVNFEEPNVARDADTDPLVNIFDFSSEEQMNTIIERLDDDNDSPPYDIENYVGSDVLLGGGLQQVARIGTEVGLGRVGRAAGFCVPFGLLALDIDDMNTDWRIVINLAPGTYHGVYAERA